MGPSTAEHLVLVHDLAEVRRGALGRFFVSRFDAVDVLVFLDCLGLGLERKMR